MAHAGLAPPGISTGAGVEAFEYDSLARNLLEGQGYVHHHLGTDYFAFYSGVPYVWLLAAGYALGAGSVVAALALGFTSAASLVLPVAIYLAGLGMVLPQAIAGAMTPFPERAGAASALLGFVQQIAAALCGAVVGWLLGENAWPLAAAVAAMGCATLVLWMLTRAVRRKAAAT